MNKWKCEICGNTEGVMQGPGDLCLCLQCHSILAEYTAKEMFSIARQIYWALECVLEPLDSYDHYQTNSSLSQEIYLDVLCGNANDALDILKRYKSLFHKEEGGNK